MGNGDPAATPKTTAPEDTDLRLVRRARVGRRVFTLAIVVLLIAALVGLLGVRTTTATAADGGYELELRYAKVARPGLAVPWDLTITKAGGFDQDQPVRVRTKSSYLDIFDENGLDPDPSKVTQDDRYLIWEFDPPPGDTLTVSFDWRIEPGVQLKRAKGETSVLRDDGDQPVATVRYETWVTP